MPPALSPVVVYDPERTEASLETEVRPMEPGDNMSCTLHRALIRLVGFNAHGSRFLNEAGQHHTLGIGVEHRRPYPNCAGKACCLHLFTTINAKQSWVSLWHPQNERAVRQIQAVIGIGEASQRNGDLL